MDEEVAENNEIVRKVAALVVARKIPVLHGLPMIGQAFVGRIQKRMAEGTPPPDAPATIKAKGSSTPLIDSGQLRQSITYKVHWNGLADGESPVTKL